MAEHQLITRFPGAVLVNFIFSAKILFHNFFWSEKFLSQKMFSVEIILLNFFSAQKNFLGKKRNFSENFLCKFILPINHFSQFSFSVKFFYLRRLKCVQDRPRNLPLKFGQDRVSIIRIWTNVARTNIPWTNVCVTVGIC